MGGDTSNGQVTSTSSFQVKIEPKLDFYLVRRDGTHVPMIALDEIDPRFRVAGLPTTLTAHDVEKWNMGRVGDIIPGPRMTYEVVYVGYQQEKMEESHATVATENSTSIGAFSEDRDASSTHSSTLHVNKEHMPTENIATSPIKDPAPYEEDHFDQAVRQHQAAINDHPSKTKDAMTPGVYGKKKYCTYWIRTGNCDYVQEGCKYLHIIPDEETRQSIGIRDMPKWAKEGLPVPDPIQRSKHSHPGMKHDWRRGRASAAEELHLPAKQSTKNIPPSIPDFLQKPNESTESRNNKVKTSLNPAAQAFEWKTNDAGTMPNTPRIPPLWQEPRRQSPSVSANWNAPPAHSNQVKITGQRKSDGIDSSKSMNGHSSPSRHEAGPSTTKPKHYAPDRMPRLPSISQTGFTDPWNSSKNYAPVTYKSSPVQSPWPSQPHFWKPRASASNPTAPSHFTSVSGIRSPSSMFESLALGRSSDDVWAHAATRPFKDFNPTSGSPRPSSVIGSGAPGSKVNDGSSSNVGGIFHPRLFAREGEPKFAVTTVQRLETPSNAQE